MPFPLIELETREHYTTPIFLETVTKISGKMDIPVYVRKLFYGILVVPL